MTQRVLPYSTIFVSLSQGCSEESVKETCAALVERVFEHSQDTTYLSPFAKEGSEALSWLYVGGKPDDITVLLAAVVDE